MLYLANAGSVNLLRSQDCWQLLPDGLCFTGSTAARARRVPTVWYFTDLHILFAFGILVPSAGESLI